MDVKQHFDPATIKLIIGLGNPGSKYTYNRHNIGFRVVEALVNKFGGSFRKQDNCEIAECTIRSNQDVFVAKPQTFMNSSGEILSKFLKKGIKAENILVVHDELEKPFAHLSLKCGGSAKGHNGLKSIISVVGDGFWRLRFGIARPLNKEDVPNYVLQNFSQDEESQLILSIEKALSLIDA